MWKKTRANSQHSNRCSGESVIVAVTDSCCVLSPNLREVSENHHSFDWGDSSKKSSPTSDLGSEISTTPSDANLIWVDKYSFFSQNDSDGPQSVDDMAEASVARYVSMLMDMVENATMRFNNSYAFSQDEASE
ncbi:hypothetical protein D910_04718 [Dendroctonus ponderosae]|uniref:Uncharacterized protein n=1 Tax=Dendroctonus ponderosae TaxID=77166 RepID=U4U4S0_DENPD|nr:hypothetical protein D910_04718 [Dendroctonus ponderosae]